MIKNTRKWGLLGATFAIIAFVPSMADAAMGDSVYGAPQYERSSRGVFATPASEQMVRDRYDNQYDQRYNRNMQRNVNDRYQYERKMQREADIRNDAADRYNQEMLRNPDAYSREAQRDRVRYDRAAQRNASDTYNRDMRDGRYDQRYDNRANRNMNTGPEVAPFRGGRERLPAGSAIVGPKSELDVVNYASRVAKRSGNELVLHTTISEPESEAVLSRLARKVYMENGGQNYRNVTIIWHLGTNDPSAAFARTQVGGATNNAQQFEVVPFNR